MKIFLTVVIIFLIKVSLKAQSFEVQQLILNVEKLGQFKQILNDMKTGYQIVSKGYSAVRDISRGNFSLHETFLDGLWLVSPAVRQYWKVPRIVSNQLQLVKAYKSALGRFNKSRIFSSAEIRYMSKVYGQLFDESVKSIDDLITVLTERKLRMNDDERMAAIDRIYAEMEDKLAFLKRFNSDAVVLMAQRRKELDDSKTMELLYQK